MVVRKAIKSGVLERLEWAEKINGADEMMITHGVALAFVFINEWVKEGACREHQPERQSQPNSCTEFIYIYTCDIIIYIYIYICMYVCLVSKSKILRSRHKPGCTIEVHAIPIGLIKRSNTFVLPSKGS